MRRGIETLVRALSGRRFQFFVLPFAVAAWFLATDPSGGADTVLRLQLWGQALLVTGIAYLVAKAMLGSASSEALFSQTMEGNVAAGVAYVGVCILRGTVLLALLVFFALVQR